MQGSHNNTSTSNSTPSYPAPSFSSASTSRLSHLPPRPEQQRPFHSGNPNPLFDRISRDTSAPGLPPRPSSSFPSSSNTSAADPKSKGDLSTSPSQRDYAHSVRFEDRDTSNDQKREHSPGPEDPSKRPRVEGHSRRAPLPRHRKNAQQQTGSNAVPMPHGHRGHGRHKANGRGKPPPPPVMELPGPVHDRQQIMNEHGQGIQIKQQWEENPKAPLANYLGGGTGGASHLGDGGKGFQVEEGMIEGKKLFRVSVLADEEDHIVGVGDAPSRKEAEKLAALSAVLQLTRAGYLEKGRAAAKNAAAIAAAGGSTSTPGVSGTAETVPLTDGTALTYDRARQFMEWYCRKYNFGKPDIDITSSTTKLAVPSGPRGRKQKAIGQTSWEAVMTVGGRRIGVGTASNKKGAQIRCYLDVVQYLESLDKDLWNEFVEATKKDPFGSVGMAPHLVFSMSDMLNDEVQTLCSDIRHSLLYYNAPQPHQVTTTAHVPQTFGPRRHWQASESELRAKSALLQDRLMQYETDPALAKMRATRQALPVYTRSSDVLAKIEVNDVTIVMAATGSGKTTQVPQMLFDDFINRGEGARCNIVCTQPRRLAAMSVAERVADERGQSLGQEVGYQVRFDNKPPQPNGSITFCTTGVFLKRMQSSLGAQGVAESIASMDQVTHVIVDEVHERDIDTDLLLVVLKRLIADRKARRKPIKVVLMSATIDPTLFQNYFTDDLGRPAPVAEVPGRTFPVTRHYLDDFLHDLQDGLPRQMGGWVFQDQKVQEYLRREMSQNPADFQQMPGITQNELDIPYPLVALTIAYALQKSTDGHVLVFLPGWDEIKKTADILLDHAGQFPLLGMNFNDSSQYSVHYLHSTIPAAEQREVFKPPPPGVRRVILATNIAETSVTIPDVVYVVDAGRVKEKRYDPERHMSSLVSAWVGASNLGQRAGRAGRHRSGEYYGILSKRRVASLEPNQMVEMKRSDLSDVVMHVKALNLGEVEEVLGAAIEPPEPSRIVAALETLHMLGALDINKNLTSLGRVLLQLPTDAAIGKLCLYGSFFRCLDSALTLAAVLTSRDPFLAPLAMKQEADEVKNSWSPLAFRSDPLAIVAAYNQWSAMDDRGEYNAANRFCQDNFLAKLTLVQIKQVKGHLLQSLDQAGVIAVSAGDRYVPRSFRGRAEVPAVLRENDNSLPLLAALIAVASAPNFAIRTSEKTCRTSQDKTVFIHPSSVNSRRREKGGPEEPSASFHPAEKRLYAFGEKSRMVQPGANPNAGITSLRSVTRLDPMTYMLFGAYELFSSGRGLECDGWLPVTGNLHALDDVQRLKTYLDTCMLRVFEGLSKALTRERDTRFQANRNVVDVRAGSSRIRERTADLDESKENESDDEGDDDMAGVSETARLQHELARRSARKVEPLSAEEIRELGMLTSDVVKILDAYADEREGARSTYSSRPATPVNPNVYRPPGARGGGMRW